VAVKIGDVLPDAESQFGHFTGIVPLEPVMQIVSMTDIMVFELVYTLKDIDI
jgi:hypothetical protein